MNLEYIFPTPIWTFEHTEGCKEMTTYIKNIKKESEGRILSNDGGWQSNDFVPDDLPECFRPFIRNILSKCRLCIHEYGSDYKPWIDNLWFNINKKGDSNKRHFHAESLLSGVFYLQCTDDSGRIQFVKQPLEDYAVISHLGKPRITKLSASAWEYNPTETMCLLFPSWLMHQVESSNSDTERISIAFNIKVS